MPLRKGQSYSRYPRPKFPSAKYRVPVSKRVHTNKGRKRQDIDGWKVS